MSEKQPPFTPPETPDTYGPPNYVPYSDQVRMPEPKYNVLAIISFVCAFFVSLAAVICGHISLSQIKKTGEKGRGLALAGVILGYLGLVSGALFIVLFFFVLASVPGDAWNDPQRPAASTSASPQSGSTLPPTRAEEAVSAYFCDTLLSIDPNGDEAATLAYLQRVSEVVSPNQEIYAEYYQLRSDYNAGATVDQDELVRIEDKFMAAADADELKCLSMG